MIWSSACARGHQRPHISFCLLDDLTPRRHLVVEGGKVKVGFLRSHDGVDEAHLLNALCLRFVKQFSTGHRQPGREHADRPGRPHVDDEPGVFGKADRNLTGFLTKQHALDVERHPTREPWPETSCASARQNPTLDLVHAEHRETGKPTFLQPLGQFINIVPGEAHQRQHVHRLGLGRDGGDSLLGRSPSQHLDHFHVELRESRQHRVWEFRHCLRQRRLHDHRQLRKRMDLEECADVSSRGGQTIRVREVVDSGAAGGWVERKTLDVGVDGERRNQGFWDDTPTGGHIGRDRADAQHEVDLPVSEQTSHADLDSHPRPIGDDDLVLRHPEVEFVLGQRDDLGTEHVEEVHAAFGFAIDENTEGHDGRFLSIDERRNLEENGNK
jgi:hypothetical protein